MAFDCFLKIEGVEGESVDDEHGGWIEVISYHHLITNPSAGIKQTGPRERCDHADFTIKKAVDKASPKLAEYCCTGAQIPTVKVSVCRATREKTPYFEVELRNVGICRYEPLAATKGDDALPTEEVGLRYDHIQWTYMVTDQKTGQRKGNVQARWNVAANTR
jgi:type VI secretion system Hcp family effector